MHGHSTDATLYRGFIEASTLWGRNGPATQCLVKLGPNPTPRSEICSPPIWVSTRTLLFAVCDFVQWEVDRNMRELFVSNEMVCKGNNPTPAARNDWPEWEFKNGTRTRIPGSFVHTVSEEAKCKTSGSPANETFTSDEIEIRIMLGQEPTNEDIGELQAVRSYGALVGCFERL